MCNLALVLILFFVHHLDLKERTDCWGSSASPNSAELCSSRLIFLYFNGIVKPCLELVQKIAVMFVKALGRPTAYCGEVSVSESVLLELKAPLRYSVGGVPLLAV